MNYDLTHVLYCGDSLVARKTNVEGDTASLGATNAQWGYAHWSSILTRKLGCWDTNTGIGGDVITNINANKKSRILDYNPTLVIMDGGGNDLGAYQKPITTIVAAMQETATACLDNGIQFVLLYFPIWLGIYGRTTSEISDGEALKLQSTYQTMSESLQRKYPNLYRYLNFEGDDCYGTTTTAVYNLNDFYRLDKIHFNQAGHQITAMKIFNFMQAEDPKIKNKDYASFSLYTRHSFI